MLHSPAATRVSSFFISSAGVYQKPVSHYLITESIPLANPYWEYAQQKIPAKPASCAPIAKRISP